MIELHVREQYFEIFRDLCSEFDDLVFWKHFDRGMKGDGDIDSFCSRTSLPLVSKRFVDRALSLSDTLYVLEHPYSTDVRLHYVVDADHFPNLFEFDVGTKQKRFGITWLDPRVLVKFSELNEQGVRVPLDGATAAILVLLYALSPFGAKELKDHDHAEILLCIRRDLENAEDFVASSFRFGCRFVMIGLLNALCDQDWPRYKIALVWWTFFITAVFKNLIRGPRHWRYLVISRLKAREHIKNHFRRADSRDADAFIDSIEGSHFILHSHSRLFDSDEA